MKEVTVGDHVRIINADMREALAAMEPDSVDSIVCDPPYGLGFMGKGWDHGVPGVEFWTEALRVLKPGGHLLAFGGTRTFHRLTVAIEDAGFEIRDCLSWMYGSGFPKSHDVSKAIDKAAGATRQKGPVDPARAGRLVNQGGDYVTEAGWSAGNRSVTIDPPATSDAARWDGWGTALKPSWEPIIMARKPFAGTVAANVLEHGTGALNIDATRIASAGEVNPSIERRKGATNHLDGGEGKAAEHYAAGRIVSRSSPEAFQAERAGEALGRWPANTMLTHDEGCQVVGQQTERVGGGANASKTETTTVDFAEGYQRGDGWVGGEVTSDVWECVESCPVRLLDEQSGVQKSGTAVQRHGGGQAIFGGIAGGENTVGARPDAGYGDKGGASRFFYSAKANKKERNAGMPEWVKFTCPECHSETDKLGRWIDRRTAPPDPSPPEPTVGTSESSSTPSACGVCGHEGVMDSGVVKRVNDHPT